MNNARENSRAKAVIGRNLENIDEASSVKKEDSLLYTSDTSSLSEHNLKYTELLNAYVHDFIVNSAIKRKHKKDMYCVAKRLLLGVPLATFILMLIALVFLACGRITVLDILPEAFTALTSLLGTLMVIPRMITKYLFNKKEEEHLSEIIGKIQEYDKDIRERL